jgi:hypothetical protein
MIPTEPIPILTYSPNLDFRMVMDQVVPMRPWQRCIDSWMLASGKRPFTYLPSKPNEYANLMDTQKIRLARYLQF